jgi:ABC-type Fe3+/spermidine/putrescine transport system ATPase subunit
MAIPENEIVNPIISFRGISKEYAGGVKAVDNIDLDIGNNEFFALLGPSGCGKTTLLRMLSGLEIPTEGTDHSGWAGHHQPARQHPPA